MPVIHTCMHIFLLALLYWREREVAESTALVVTGDYKYVATGVSFNFCLLFKHIKLALYIIFTFPSLSQSHMVESNMIVCLQLHLGLASDNA
ncbi:hypothetical protein DFP73DRAFT_383909 [Morchella snyderi]|nr:hypothetical protein DFP73DRAFT_383909 [Morchella snyderi]